MGNRFSITVLDESQKNGEEKIQLAVNEIIRIEKLLTTFSDESQTNLINKNAGIMPVKVDPEIISLIIRSKKISELTHGLFDISYGSVAKTLWNFDKTINTLPDAQVFKDRVKLIDYNNIEVDVNESKVFLKNKGMRIGFGGIGKGYAADMGANLLKKAGITSGIVNASGDLVTWGRQPSGKPWNIQLAHPDSPTNSYSKMNISDLAVATSGNYEKFAIIDGKRYSHTIHPKTGMPVEGLKSVTVICPYAELADALATPLGIMGVDQSLNLVNQMKGLACVLIDNENRVFTSDNIKLD
jgi:thiamine biosynthesis lipoprotein